MLLKEIYLLEERKSPLEQLKEIQKEHNDKQYVSVSFTNINKVGINPKPMYEDTPIGIYCYPISYVLKQNMKVPTAGGARFLQVLKPKNLSKVWDLQRTDNKKGEEILRRLIGSAESIYQIRPEQSIKLFNQTWPEENFTNRVYYFVVRLAIKISNEVGGKYIPYVENKLLRNAQIDVIVDNVGIIHESEPVQTVFLSVDAIDKIKTIERFVVSSERNFDENFIKTNDFTHEIDNSLIHQQRNKKLENVILNALNKNVEIGLSAQGNIGMYAGGFLKSGFWKEIYRFFDKYREIQRYFNIELAKKNLIDKKDIRRTDIDYNSLIM